MKRIGLCGVLGSVFVVSALGIQGQKLAQASAKDPTQNPGLHRTIMQRADASAPGHEMVMARVELDPQTSAGRHTHPGEEMAYVIEGEAELSIEGQPTRTVKAGDAFVVPAGTKHDVRNAGTTPFKVVAVYLVEKGKPLATPAP